MELIKRCNLLLYEADTEKKQCFLLAQKNLELVSELDKKKETEERPGERWITWRDEFVVAEKVDTMSLYEAATHIKDMNISKIACETISKANSIADENTLLACRDRVIQILNEQGGI